LIRLGWRRGGFTLGWYSFAHYLIPPGTASNYYKLLISDFRFDAELALTNPVFIKNRRFGTQELRATPHF
jgi:hypothetical protein